jgi:hypothetical protein
MKAFVFVVVLLNIFLSGCAVKKPLQKNIHKKGHNFQLPSMSKGNRIDVYIYWQGTGESRLGDIAYRLDNDKDNIAKLFYKEHTHFTTTPGKHTIHWIAKGKSSLSTSNQAAFNFVKGKTYIIRQNHAVIFNRYSKDGHSLLDSMEIEKDNRIAKYQIFISKKSKLTASCVKKKTVSLKKENCI